MRQKTRPMQPNMCLSVYPLCLLSYCQYKRCANSANSWVFIEYLSMWRSQFRPGRLVLLVRRKSAGTYLRTNIAKTNKRNPRSQSPRGLVSQSHSRIRWSNNYWSIAPTSQWDYLRTPKVLRIMWHRHIAKFAKEKKLQEVDEYETVPAYTSTW